MRAELEHAAGGAGVRGRSRALGALTATAALLAAGFVALGAGEAWINPLGARTELEATILWELRLPRVLSAFGVGALLALAGAWFQVLLGNPLAEPYVLGVAGSSAVGAIGMLALAPGGTLFASAGAFAGACAGVLAILPFARLGPARLLLAGVVLAAFWGALVALLLALLPERRLGLALGWLMGNLAARHVPLELLFGVLGIAVAAGLGLARPLDRLMLGEAHARALGVDVRRLRLALLLLASGATACAVTAAGTIGFVGLVVPHAVRLVAGPLHRTLLPVSALAGGALLAIADTGARSVIAPAELPVGVITAFLGVPVFLWLLSRRA